MDAWTHGLVDDKADKGSSGGKVELQTEAGSFQRKQGFSYYPTEESVTSRAE